MNLLHSVPRTNAVHVDGLCMDFRGKRVIDSLSFDVRTGEIFGLLGSNGCGKTTTIRALLGIHQPTAGTLHIGGRKFAPEQTANVGYLPEERGLYRKEPVIDIMAYFGRLKGLSRKAARSWSLNYLEAVGLADKARTRLDKLSGGQQQKIQLGVTIMNNPELLILDEPAKGLDPVNRRLLMNVIEQQKQAGATVMLVTHQMDEVERLCDRVLLLKDGRAEATGTVSDVQKQYGQRTAKLHFTGLLPTSTDYTISVHRPGYAELVLDSQADGTDILHRFIKRGVGVSSFTVSATPLEDIFLDIYGEAA